MGYIDPGHWATGIQAGAQFGYALLFVVLLLRPGFQCEGLLRQCRVHKGAAYDTNIYGLLATDQVIGAV